MKKHDKIMLEAMSLLLEELPSLTLTEAAQVIEELEPLLGDAYNDEVIMTDAEELCDEALAIIETERRYLVTFKGSLTEEDDIRNNEYAMGLVLDLVLAR